MEFYCTQKTTYILRIVFFFFLLKTPKNLIYSLGQYITYSNILRMSNTLPTPTEYFHINILVKAIIDEVALYMKNTPKEVIAEEIQKAYLYARNAHEGQLRKSGDPYIIHPVEATRELLILRPDIVTIQSCLLHDVPEDTEKTVENIREIFGDEVAHITA